MKNTLSLSNLSVSTDGRTVVNDVSFAITSGEVHALLGQNGSGKSSLANALMGHPAYEITGGNIRLDDTELTELSPDKRAKAGLFLSMQYPPSIAGVSLSNFLRTAYNATHEEQLSPVEFHGLLKEKMALLEMDPSFAARNVNEGFSGGEKKRAEVLQLLVLEPSFAILDETDSGLDVDARKIVADGIRKARERGAGILLITHHLDLLEELGPEAVHVMKDSSIERSGRIDLAREVIAEGF
ncbi:MAG: Fe-S cluster assembly ATPase SufC, partial [Candidatus Andersenbacteria bacterium]|nr:Fe-S cluster assembly ATPase SufC [Candidatus Andersenbacteria bacterium]